ncbi:protein FAM47E [Opisthocomus hoazin]|uniref:protein FAM47E n=1 Tax=Opisthocomus hoazin TaxID=30419 RepID=UPI003F535FC5
MKCAKTQVTLSKLSLLQQARRDYVAQIECCLNQHPLVLYPRLEKSIYPKHLREDAGVLDRQMILKSKAGYSDYEQENQPLQEVLAHVEDTQSKVTASKTRVHGKESQGKTPRTQHSKKAAARQKEARLTDFLPSEEHVKREIKHFCDWVMSLGGGNCNIDEDALITLLNTSSEREATVPSPYHALKFNNVQAEQAKGQKISSLPLAVTNSHHLRTLPCQVKEKDC